MCGIGLLAVVAGSVSAWYTRQQSRAKAEAASHRVPPAPPPPSEIALAGRIQPRTTVAIPAPIEGNVDRFLVDVGDEVFEGEVLARIKNTKLDSTEESAQLDAERATAHITELQAQLIATRLEASRARSEAARARAEFERLEKAYKRQQLLLNEGATPRLTYEKAQKDYENAKADNEAQSELTRKADDQVDSLSREIETAKKLAEAKSQDLETAKSQVAAGEVRSPVNGLLVARRGNPGEPVDPSMTDLFRVATDLSNMEVMVDPDPRDLPRIHAGQAALIQVAEIQEPIAGAVREVQTTHVLVDFTSPSPAIKPGLTAQVKIKLS